MTDLAIRKAIVIHAQECERALRWASFIDRHNTKYAKRAAVSFRKVAAFHAEDALRGAAQLKFELAA